MNKNVIQWVERQEIESREFGFCWENLDQLIKQIQSECVEIVEARASGDEAHLEEELGDLMHAAITLAVFCGMNPEKALLKSTEKYQKRFEKVVELAKQDGHTSLKNQPFSLLLAYWKRAKEL